MTPEDLREHERSIGLLLINLNRQASDYECEEAHITEDAIYLTTLRFIAEHASDPWARVARAALAADNVAYPRWYA